MGVLYELRSYNVHCCVCNDEFITAKVHDTRYAEVKPDAERCNICLEKYIMCCHCHKYVEKNNELKKRLSERYDCEYEFICKECQSQYHECSKCGLSHKIGNGVITSPDTEYCKVCAGKVGFHECFYCHKWHKKKDIDGDRHFPSCASCKTKRSEWDDGKSSCSSTPTYYSNVCKKALAVQKKYKLSDAQTLMYNHICRGDFYLRNGLGKEMYDLHHDLYSDGGSNDRKWVKRQLQILIDAKLVKFEALRNCRSQQCVSWVFYDPKFKYESLVNAECFVTTHALALIKYYLKLPDGFYKDNKTYGKVKFLYKDGAYGFEYKGVSHGYNYNNGFDETVHELWECMTRDGYKYLGKIKGYRATRKFKI